jgi:Leucine-rich repeat (LRR) protein
MKSLLKFATTEDRVRELMEICRKKGYVLQHIKHQEPLTEEIIREGGFTVNFGGYGSYSRIGLGNNFGSKWEVSALEASPGKGFAEVEVCFGAGLDETKMKAVAEYIKKQGGLINDGDVGNCDLCILPAGAADEQNLLDLIGKMVDGAKGFLAIDIDEFLGVIPAIKKPRPKTAKAAQLSDELKQLQKQLQERNRTSIETALKTLEGRYDDIDLLIQGVSVDPAGELDRGPKFKGSGLAMEFLDLSLAGLLSQAGENSEAARLRGSIRKLRFAVKSLPQLKGFNALEELEIILNRVDNVDESKEVAKLGCFAAMPKLRKFRITNESGYDIKSLAIKSLDGLEAESLEELEASGIGLESIEGLKGCRQLKTLDLSSNSDLSSISGLADCATIEVLRLNETGITSLEPMSTCKGLAELNLNDCKNLKSIKGLDAPKLESFELRQLDLASLDGIKKLKGIKKLDLAGLHKLKDLSPLSSLSKLEELELYNLTSVKELPALDKLTALKAVTIGSCDALSDVSSLATANALQRVSIGECRNLEAGPIKWSDGLVELTISRTKLRDLGICPATLTELCISNNGHLKNLNGLSSCTSIEVSSWGLDLSGCFQLESLDGLNLPKLEAISIPETIGNLAALNRYPGIQITIVAGQGKEKGYQTLVEDIPTVLGDALLALAPTHLIVKTAWSAELQKISGIGRVTSLTSLDLSDCDLADITAIAGLDKLELLKVQPRTELSKALGKATFDSKSQIDKLRLKLLAGL